MITSLLCRLGLARVTTAHRESIKDSALPTAVARAVPNDVSLLHIVHAYLVIMTICQSAVVNRTLWFRSALAAASGLKHHSPAHPGHCPNTYCARACRRPSQLDDSESEAPLTRIRQPERPASLRVSPSLSEGVERRGPLRALTGTRSCHLLVTSSEAIWSRRSRSQTRA